MRRNRLAYLVLLLALCVLPLLGNDTPEEVQLTETQSLKLENAHLRYSNAVQQFRVLSQQLEELRELISQEPGKEGDLWKARGQSLVDVCAEISKETGKELDPNAVDISADFKRLMPKESE